MAQETSPPAGEDLLVGPGEEEPDPRLSVAQMLAEVSELLVGADDVDATLGSVCRLAVEHIPGCEAAGVSLLTRDGLRSIGATSAPAEVVGEMQGRHGEGPSLDAIRERDVVEVDDLATDSRWPAFARAVVEESAARSIIAFRLSVGDRVMGALTLCSSQEEAFDGSPRTADLGRLFARHAAVALAGAQALDGLRAALESRETISVAMGIMMAREGISRARAFDVLRRASQRENIKLRDIAARIAGEADSVLSSGG